MKTFRPSRAFRFANKATAALLRWGAPMGPSRTPLALLTVPGRNTGVPRTSAVALTRVENGWLLVAVYGNCDWSRNLEKAGDATVTWRRRTARVAARRLDPAEAAPLLRDLMTGAPALIRSMTVRYFSAGATSPLAEWEREALDHPVFSLTVLDGDAAMRVTEDESPEPGSPSRGDASTSGSS